MQTVSPLLSNLIAVKENSSLSQSFCISMLEKLGDWHGNEPLESSFLVTWELSWPCLGNELGSCSFWMFEGCHFWLVRTKMAPYATSCKTCWTLSCVRCGTIRLKAYMRKKIMQYNMVREAETDIGYTSLWWHAQKPGGPIQKIERGTPELPELGALQVLDMSHWFMIYGSGSDKGTSERLLLVMHDLSLPVPHLSFAFRIRDG